MIKSMRESSLYIALAGPQTVLDKHGLSKVDKVFKEIFGDSSKKASVAQEEEEIEVVYEIQKPIVQDEILMKEFFENLEIILEELQEFTPHFTQLKRGGY